MTDQRLSLLRTGTPALITRLATDTPISGHRPGVLVLAIAMRVAPVAKGLPVTASGAAFAMFLPLMFCDVCVLKPC